MNERLLLFHGDPIAPSVSAYNRPTGHDVHTELVYSDHSDPPRFVMYDVAADGRTWHSPGEVSALSMDQIAVAELDVFQKQIQPFGQDPTACAGPAAVRVAARVAMNRARVAMVFLSMGCLPVERGGRRAGGRYPYPVRLLRWGRGGPSHRRGSEVSVNRGPPCAPGQLRCCLACPHSSAAGAFRVGPCGGGSAKKFPLTDDAFRAGVEPATDRAGF